MRGNEFSIHSFFKTTANFDMVLMRASMIVYEETNSFQDEATGSWTLVEKDHNPLHPDLQVYATFKSEKPDGCIILAFRGTESVIDWGGNTVWGLSAALNIPPLENGIKIPALAAFEKARKRFPSSEIVVCGHSLGGMMSQYVAKEYNVAGAAFNTFAIPGMNSFSSNRKYFHVHQHDIIPNGHCVPLFSAQDNSYHTHITYHKALQEDFDEPDDLVPFLHSLEPLLQNHLQTDNDGKAKCTHNQQKSTMLLSQLRVEMEEKSLAPKTIRYEGKVFPDTINFGHFTGHSSLDFLEIFNSSLFFEETRNLSKTTWISGLCGGLRVLPQGILNPHQDKGNFTRLVIKAEVSISGRIQTFFDRKSLIPMHDAIKHSLATVSSKISELEDKTNPQMSEIQVHLANLLKQKEKLQKELLEAKSDLCLRCLANPDYAFAFIEELSLGFLITYLDAKEEKKDKKNVDILTNFYDEIVNICQNEKANIIDYMIETRHLGLLMMMHGSVDELVRPPNISGFSLWHKHASNEFLDGVKNFEASLARATNQSRSIGSHPEQYFIEVEGRFLSCLRIKGIFMGDPRRQDAHLFVFSVLRGTVTPLFDIGDTFSLGGEINKAIGTFKCWGEVGAELRLGIHIKCAKTWKLALFWEKGKKRELILAQEATLFNQKATFFVRCCLREKPEHLFADLEFGTKLCLDYKSLNDSIKKAMELTFTNCSHWISDTKRKIKKAAKKKAGKYVGFVISCVVDVCAFFAEMSLSIVESLCKVLAKIISGVSKLVPELECYLGCGLYSSSPGFKVALRGEILHMKVSFTIDVTIGRLMKDIGEAIVLIFLSILKSMNEMTMSIGKMWASPPSLDGFTRFDGTGGPSSAGVADRSHDFPSLNLTDVTGEGEEQDLTDEEIAIFTQLMRDYTLEQPTIQNELEELRPLLAGIVPESSQSYNPISQTFGQEKLSEFLCMYCKEEAIFESMESLVEHYRVQHPNETNELEDIDSIKCQNLGCDSEFNGENCFESFEKHASNCEGFRNCELCGEETKAREYSVHLRISHGQEKEETERPPDYPLWTPQKCDKCGETIFGDLISHKENFCKFGKCIHDNCKKEGLFKIPAVQAYHDRNECNFSIQTCQECAEQVKSKDMEEHRCTYKNRCQSCWLLISDEHHQCHNCGLVDGTEKCKHSWSRPNSHTAAHLAENLWSCGFCKGRFKKGELFTHWELHCDKIPNIFCKLTEKAIPSCNEKIPMGCLWCDWEGPLDWQHYLNHFTLPCPFEGCNSRFKSEEDLREHLYSICPKNRLVCPAPQCGEQLNSKTFLSMSMLVF